MVKSSRLPCRADSADMSQQSRVGVDAILKSSAVDLQDKDTGGLYSLFVRITMIISLIH